jgi:hypothetical protein
VSHAELYRLAKAGDPACIEGLLDLITEGALEILRLECKYERNRPPPVEESLRAVQFMKSFSVACMRVVKVYESRAFK